MTTFRLATITLISALAIAGGCAAPPTPINVDYYPEIARAQDGDVVSIRGYVDGKGICTDHATDAAPESCETALYRRCPFAYVPIRLMYCDDHRRTNCIVRLPSVEAYSHFQTPQDYLRDNSGKSFTPGAEVEMTVTVGNRPSGWKVVRSVDHIEIVEGGFDPVNGCPTPTP